MVDIIKKVGAPTKITPDIETKLESILKVGGTIAEATSYAGIGERTYYDRAKASEVFSQKMKAAKHYADIVAKNVVVNDIVKNKDVQTAKWWLEKRQFRDSGIQIQGEKVLVIPAELMEKHGITSDTKGSSKEQ